MVDGKVNCTIAYQKDSPVVANAVIAAGKQRHNGDIVFAWACT
jgi:hypothetical protein